MQAGKNNPEIQLMSLFGRYFSALKLERQLDCVVFQAKAGREELGLGSLPARAAARPPLPLTSALAAQNISAALAICGDTGELILTRPCGPCISLRPVSSFPCHTSPPDIKGSEQTATQRVWLERVYLSCSGFSCWEALISSRTNL